MAIARSLSIPSTRPKTVSASGEVRGNRAGWKEAMPMAAKYKGRPFCTDLQRQQIMGTYDYFQELHREADAGLQQMGRSTYTDKLNVLLVRIADEIASGLKFLVEISSSVQEQAPRVVFEVSVVCSNCTAPPAETRDNPGVCGSTARSGIPR